jgi:uncharacterized damage-inducible protein DinB
MPVISDLRAPPRRDCITGSLRNQQHRLLEDSPHLPCLPRWHALDSPAWPSLQYVPISLDCTGRGPLTRAPLGTAGDSTVNQKDIQLLYEYNRWANARMLDVASELTAEQLTRDLSSSHYYVRDTLVHILSGECIWLMRWQGTSSKAIFNPADFPHVSMLRTKWAEVERGQTDFIHTVTEESLGTVIAYINTMGEEWRYPLGQMMQHVVNHSSYHRGQVTTMLRQLGVETVPTDFLVFIDIKSGSA